MEITKNIEYWYGQSLNKTYKYSNLTKKNLKNKTKEELQKLYNDYSEYKQNLSWEYEKASEYHNVSRLKKLDNEIERAIKNLSKIEAIYNLKETK